MYKNWLVTRGEKSLSSSSGVVFFTSYDAQLYIREQKGDTSRTRYRIWYRTPRGWRLVKTV